MGLPHVFPDEVVGTGQPRDDVALAIGYQDRGRRRQSTFFEVIRQPSQVEAGEHDPRDVAITPVEPLREMYHLLAADGVDPVISYGKPGLGHSPSEERLICYRRGGGPARTKDSTGGVCCPHQAVVCK